MYLFNILWGVKIYERENKEVYLSIYGSRWFANERACRYAGRKIFGVVNFTTHPRARRDLPSLILLQAKSHLSVETRETDLHIRPPPC